jgi:O-succinylbenzoic acid--CoA ligase
VSVFQFYQYPNHYRRSQLLGYRCTLISNEQIYTNDIVELVGENQFVFLGRMDNIINSGGIKLIPEKSKKNCQIKLSRDFFCKSTEDADLGEKINGD